LAFPPIRVIPQHSEHQNRTKIWFASPDNSNTSARPFIREPKNGLQVCVAWRYRLHRWFHKGTQKHTSAMSPLAAMDSPLGGFWKFSRNSNFNRQQRFMEIKHMHISYNSCISIKFNVNNFPSLVSLAYFEIVVSSPLITNALPLTLSQCNSFPHSILIKLSIFVLLSLYNNNKCSHLPIQQ